jgi:lipopolysaccharide/colanic/teichoic acid biosynthesis glycosyltransferase
MLKRTLDILVSGVALLLLWPVLILIALVIRWKMGSPILFRQLRPGLHGEPFELIKFRTMAHDPAAGVSSDAQRLTRLGRFLRASSLDELPELWNVLRGDMSLVGPRPLLMQYLPRYSPEQARRHEVRPGLTGWAQVNGRNAIGWDAKFELDVWYVDNRSFLLDIKILAMTALRLLRPSGISGGGAATMTEFMGPERRTVESQRDAE